MSHPEQPIVCPNCGFKAVGNYCAECGQKTHLHKETFWGLVAHFIGDYFHYDSKFWQTLKALWFSPGKLTVAYWNRQRMRYIPPVSLYIFISAVYFLLSLNSRNTLVQVNDVKPAPNKVVLTTKGLGPGGQNVNDFLDRKVEKINKRYGNVSDFILDKINHNLPKIFFFMIPVMAMLLKLLFIRRKNLFFVDHAIFSLHYHSFWFSLFAIDLFNFPLTIKLLVTSVLLLAAIYYMIAAMRNTYGTSWLRSVINSLVLSVGYAVFLLIAFCINLLLIVVFA